MSPRPESPLESEISDFAEIICGEDGMIPPVKHTRMMLLCTRAFIMEFLENCRTGQIHERAAVNILDEIREVLSSADAEKANSLWGFDYLRVWPFDQLREFNGDKISRWLQHRFPADVS